MKVSASQKRISIRTLQRLIRFGRDLHQEQAFRRRGDSGLTTIVGSQNRWQLIFINLPPPHIHQGSGDVANHSIQEAVSHHLYLNVLPLGLHG